MLFLFVLIIGAVSLFAVDLQRSVRSRDTRTPLRRAPYWSALVFVALAAGTSAALSSSGIDLRESAASVLVGAALGGLLAGYGTALRFGIVSKLLPHGIGHMENVLAASVGDSLRSLRVIWIVFVAAQALGVAIAVLFNRGVNGDSTIRVLPLLLAGVAVTGAHAIRYYGLARARNRDGTVTPAYYLLATVKLYAVYEFVALFVLLTSIEENGGSWVLLLLGALLLLLMLNYPTGRPLRNAGPALRPTSDRSTLER